MQIKVVLFSNFREMLPPENRGRTTIDLQEGANIQDALEKLGIHIHAIVSLNGQVERDFETTLKDGDEIQVFRPIGGGSSPYSRSQSHGILTYPALRITFNLSLQPK